MSTESFSPEEKEQIYSMAENITGNCQQGNYRRSIILSNVLRRIKVSQSKNLQEYLQFSVANDNEFAHLLSSFTIHTTEWFREMPHYKKFESILMERFKNFKKFRIQSGGCSTGEEVYSFGLLLEFVRKSQPGFDYDFQAFDIDPVCVEIAKKALYPLKDYHKIPAQYQKWVPKTEQEDVFSPDGAVKARSHFFTDNLVKLQSLSPSFEAIVCRNVLIYFTPDKVKEILAKLVQRLVPGGILIIGHSDSLDPKDFHLKALGNSMFEKI
jgi:chemotaxis protein methyltransferase CheR